MGVNPNAYSDLFVTLPENQIGFVQVNRHALLVRDAFHRAAAGQDVITSELMDTLTGEPVHLLYRSYDEKRDYSQELSAIADIINRKNRGESSPKDPAKLDQNIKALALQSGLSEAHIKSALEQYEKDYVEDLMFEKSARFSSLSKEAGETLSLEIGRALAKRARGEILSPEENARLEEDLEIFRLESGYSKDLVDRMAAEFPNKKGIAIAETLSKAISDTANFSAGGYTPSPTGQANIGVMQIPGDTTSFDVKKPFPGTPDQLEFLIALHEGAHGKQGINEKRQNDSGIQILAKNSSNSTNAIMTEEVGGDMEVINFLNDAIKNGDPNAAAQKEWWLQRRQVNSFYGDTIHDSATFIRLYEATGRQIDLQKLYDEKTGLLKKIDARFGKGGSRENTEMTMGVVQDLLREDAANPENQLLSPVQRAEAQSYLEDAEALGYRANPDYPKPEAQSEQKPVAQTAPQKPAWAATPAA